MRSASPGIDPVGSRGTVGGRNMKRILIIKLCCVGDILFTTPAVRALRRGFPRARLSYLVGSWSKEVVEDNPHLDQIIVYDAPGHSPSRWKALSQSLTCVRQLRGQNFDLAVIFHRTPLSALLAMLAGIPGRAGFDCAGAGGLLTQKTVFDAQKHEVDRYLSLVISLGVEPAGLFTEMQLNPREQGYASHLLRTNDVGEDDLLIGILVGGGKNPGTSMPTKRWPPAKFARLADSLTREYEAKVVLVGGPGDEDAVNQVASEMESPAINLVGKTTFKQLAAVLKRCRLFVGGDSGPLHIAAAVGTPTVGIFGPSDPRLVAPRGGNHLAVWRNVPCSPCYRPDTVRSRNDFTKCSQGTLQCMNEICVEEVLSSCDQLMQKVSHSS
jgi:lipopolysaccharide heptosyltransferase II